MREQRTVEEEAYRRAQIKIREEEILAKLRQERELARRNKPAFTNDRSVELEGSSPPVYVAGVPWVLVVVVAGALLVWFYSNSQYKSTPTVVREVPPSFSEEDPEVVLKRFGISDDASDVVPTPTDPTGSYKPSHEGLGFYGEAAKRTMWD